MFKDKEFYKIAAICVVIFVAVGLWLSSALGSSCTYQGELSLPANYQSAEMRFTKGDFYHFVLAKNEEEAKKLDFCSDVTSLYKSKAGFISTTPENSQEIAISPSESFLIQSAFTLHHKGFENSYDAQYLVLKDGQGRIWLLSDSFTWLPENSDKTVSLIKNGTEVGIFSWSDLK